MMLTTILYILLFWVVGSIPIGLAVAAVLRLSRPVSAPIVKLEDYVAFIGNRGSA